LTDKTPKTAGSYTADDFSALEGLEAVVRRPGMYIGSSDSKGLNHLAFEVFDNAVDEALAGHCSRIELILHQDGSVEISDNGRGIPVDINSKTGKSGVVMAYTMLHAGGKFGGSGYGASGGLHGVGAAVTTALSTRVDVTVYRNGDEHKISFIDLGKPVLFDGPTAGATSKKVADIQKTGTAPKGHTGTAVRFWPNLSLFVPGSAMDRDVLVERARKTAFLVPNLSVNVRDLRGESAFEETFKFDGGIKDMVDFLTAGKPLCDVVSITGIGTFSENVPQLDANGNMVNQETERHVDVKVAFRWDNGYDTNVQTFVNVVTTPNGGTHLKGFERGLLAEIRKAYDGTRLMKASEDPPTLEDAQEGLTAVVFVSVPEPQFVGQTKDALGTADVLKIVQDVVATGVKNWIEGSKTKNQARLVLEKVANAARNRVASRTQREAARRKTALEGASMPAKLVDCRAIGVDRSEIFLVEGDSALGSARQGRNSEYQALLPLRGKILNVQKASMADMLKNAECAAIIQCIGAGSGRTFDIDQMRYGRVMLMADADVDGSHIRSLLLVLFAKYMRPVIEEGRMFAAMPPLHKIEVMGKGGETIYTYTAEEMEQTVARLEKAGKKVKNPIQRYKGLGEMNADVLWETTMNPATRSVRRITMEDIAEAERVLELTMGDEVAPRREWIISNAQNIDRDAIDV
jgi:DNA gyrase subunit B